MPSNKKKKKSKKEPTRNPTEEFFASSMMQPPSIQSTAEGMEQMMKNMVSAYQTNQEMGMFGPPKVTPAVKERIRRLPESKQIWFADCQSDHFDEGVMYMGSVYLVDKEHGSNGNPLPDSDGISLILATATSMNPSRTRLDQFPILLGAIVKACLEPMGGMQSPMFQPKSTCKQAFPSRRPDKVLLPSSGTLQQLQSDLEDMGITNLAVAESALVQSAATTWDWSEKTQSNQQEELFSADPNDPDQFRRAAASAIMSRGVDVYVSEEPRPMRGWKPPADVNLPADWYVCPPSGANYRLTELWGWRTNLERATLQADTAKVQEIVARNDPEQVREFCECRILLTKVAEKGMLNACRALLDYCGVSVEGVQAADAPAHWRPIQRSVGDATGTTPLHRAAFEGHLPVVEFLLEREASITAVDEQARGTALLHAVSQGHTDCVRALCKHGSDLAFYSPLGGEALDLSMTMEMQGGSHVLAQQKVREVLREYDPRCSNCRSDGPVKRCPCRMEKYCGRACQRARWKEHKRLHNQKVNQ